MVLSSEKNAHEMAAISSVCQAMAGYIYPYLTEFYMWQGSIHNIMIFCWQYITITTRTLFLLELTVASWPTESFHLKNLSKQVKLINPLYFKHSTVFISPFSAARIKESHYSVVYWNKKLWNNVYLTNSPLPLIFYLVFSLAFLIILVPKDKLFVVKALNLVLQGSGIPRWINANRCSHFCLYFPVLLKTCIFI